MKRSAILIMLAALLLPASTLACEYVPGENRFLDYANCRYGEDSVVVVDLPEGSSWTQCIYQVQAFMPPKLLAITREKAGKEEVSINSRGSIGNPCYLIKRACDAALKNQQASG